MKRSFALTSRLLAALLLWTSLFSTGYLPDSPASAEPSEVNVFAAEGVKATASGYLSSEYAPSGAIDGHSDSGKWSDASDEGSLPDEGHPYWLKIDVGAEATVDRFVISHASAAGEPDDLNTRDFTIETSSDDKNWTPVVTVTNNTYGTTTHDLEQPVQARYFKLNITNPGGQDPETGKAAANIYEFQAFGSLAATPVAETPSVETPAADIPVTGISLNPPTLVLTAGETSQLTAALEPKDAAQTSITWSSDRPDIATVSEEGLVTAVSAGTTGISATTKDGGFKASSLITVQEGAVQGAAAAAGGKLIDRGSEWSYLDDGTGPGAGWQTSGYDDSGWKRGAAPLGYASSGKGLDLQTRIGYGPDGNNKYITAYFRKKFQIEDADAVKQLAATLVRDDGAIIYLNGQEVYRTNMPQGSVTSSTPASSAVADEREDFAFTIDPSLLVNGTNVLAAEVHQNAATSSDLFYSLELTGSDAVPPVIGKDQGLLGEYYTGTSDFGFGQHTATVVDSQINFSNLDNILQSLTGSQDHANVRWTGQIVPPQSGDYTFYMIGDNGFRLWIDDQLVIDHWVNDWDKEQTSLPVTLEGGTKYRFKVEYFEDFGGSNLYLRWSTSAMNKDIVPSSAFYLPENYTGPLSGSVAADGLRLKLTMNADLADLPTGLQDHFTLQAGGQPVSVTGAEQGSDSSDLILRFADTVLPNQSLQLSYDGKGGLKLADGTDAASFMFTPANLSEVVDYSPMAIAMSFHDEAKTNRSFAWYTSYEKPDHAPSNIKDSVAEIVPAGQNFDSKEVKRYVGEPEDTRVLNLKITNSTTGSFISHKVNAEGLAPGTAYQYRVGSDGNWSATGSFTTEKEDENSFDFLYLTDSQGGNSHDYEVWADTLKNGLADYPNAKFMVMTGDEVDAGSLESQWLDYFGKPQDMLLHLPIMAAVGNHEGPYNDNYYYHFNYPNDSIDDPLPPGSVYSFDYGDAHIMVLNTMDIGWDDRQKESFNQQIDWLKREVAETDRKWKIVAFHKAIYSLGNHALDSDILQLRQTLYPVFDELGIDVVLQGHDHTFMRSYQMYNDKPVANVKTDENGSAVNPDGTLYMINNSSGTKYYDLKNGVDRYYAATYQQPYEPIYSGIQMTEDSFTIQSYKSGEQSPFDTYTILRKDDSRPDPVQDLTAGRTGEGKTVLSWTKPKDKSPEDAVRGFRIYEVNGKLGKNWSAYVPAAEGKSSYQYAVEGSKSGETYEFAVRAVDKRDNSEASAVSTGDSVPAAPTAPVVDDGHNTFGWTNVPGYAEWSDYEYSVDGGKTWSPVTANPQLVGDQDYAAGSVMVRVKADEDGGRPAGLPLRSDQAFTVNSVHNTYSITGTVKRDDQLQVDVTIDALADYDGKACVVFELLNGNTPILINSIPLGRDQMNYSQYFNVSGADYRVKVFVFDRFDSDLNVPLQLAKPALLK
ncbi:PA14 domain-containing protein [Paenibacillus sp. XY044]|uniref:PA14 domain-containing protein n=1 Tax=Paenibacillus sp. XY044 TaxID=2026089 RepID=UPI00211AF59D|nr:PA14 domain-containing protein [Paenibacillus sp. XY044]